MVRRNVANDQRNTDAVRHLREVIRRALKKGGLSKIFGETNEEDIINIMN